MIFKIKIPVIREQDLFSTVIISAFIAVTISALLLTLIAYVIVN